LLAGKMRLAIYLAKPSDLAAQFYINSFRFAVMSR
jgi:hypothetical protein